EEGSRARRPTEPRFRRAATAAAGRGDVHRLSLHSGRGGHGRRQRPMPCPSRSCLGTLAAIGVFHAPTRLLGGPADVYQRVVPPKDPRLPRRALSVAKIGSTGKAGTIPRPSTSPFRVPDPVSLPYRTAETP